MRWPGGHPTALHYRTQNIICMHSISGSALHNYKIHGITDAHTSRKQHTAAKSLLKKCFKSDPRVRKPKWGNLRRQMKQGPPTKPPETQNHRWYATHHELQEEEKEPFASDTVATKYKTLQDAHPRNQEIIDKETLPSYPKVVNQPTALYYPIPTSSLCVQLQIRHFFTTNFTTHSRNQRIILKKTTPNITQKGWTNLELHTTHHQHHIHAFHFRFGHFLSLQTSRHHRMHIPETNKINSVRQHFKHLRKLG